LLDWNLCFNYGLDHMYQLRLGNDIECWVFELLHEFNIM